MKLAMEIIGRLNEDGVPVQDQCAALITALGLVVTTQKHPQRSVMELKLKCQEHIAAVIDVLHVAREAQSPAR